MTNDERIQISENEYLMVDNILKYNEQMKTKKIKKYKDSLDLLICFMDLAQENYLRLTADAKSDSDDIIKADKQLTRLHAQVIKYRQKIKDLENSVF